MISIGSALPAVDEVWFNILHVEGSIPYQFVVISGVPVLPGGQGRSLRPGETSSWFSN